VLPRTREAADALTSTPELAYRDDAEEELQLVCAAAVRRHPIKAAGISSRKREGGLC
jgi:hypothetical protein